MTNDDDVRAMLRSRAAEATVSDDAYDRIEARLGSGRANPVRRRLAAAGGVAAAAVVAGALVLSQGEAPLPEVASPPATTTTSTTAVEAPGTTVVPTDLPPHVYASPAGIDWSMEETARGFLLSRTEVQPSRGEVTTTGNDAGTVLFRSGPVVSEVFLRRLGEQWVVDSAASDLVPIHDPVYERGMLSAVVAVEANGELTLTTGGAVEVGGGSDERMTVERLQQVPVRSPLDDQRYARVEAVLRTDEGTIAVSAVWATDHTADPASPTAEIVSVWPATDAEGLALLQEDADAGRRPDLLDPQAVAGGYLSELFPRDESSTTFAIGDFQQGDNTSGEVAYRLGVTGEVDVETDPDGTILLRREGEGGIWHVHAVTSRLIEFESSEPTEQGGLLVRLTAGMVGNSVEALVRTTGGAESGGRTDLVEHQTEVTVEIPDARGARWVRLLLRDYNAPDSQVLALAVERLP